MFPLRKVACSQCRSRVNDSLCESLCCWDQHQPIPHYPLVVELVIKDDIITIGRMHQMQLFKEGLRHSIFVVFVPGFGHDVG